MQLKNYTQITILLVSLHGYVINIATSTTAGRSKRQSSWRKGRLRKSQERHYVGKARLREVGERSQIGQRLGYSAEDRRNEERYRERYFNISGVDIGHEIKEKRYGEMHQKYPSRRVIDPFRKALLQGQQTFENSVMLENWKEKNQYSITRNLKRAKKVYGSRSNIRSVKIFHPGSFSPGVRVHNKRSKSSIPKEVRVHGHSGSLNVHTTTDETRLVSKSGDLDLFIKNNDHDEHVMGYKGGEKDTVNTLDSRLISDDKHELSKRAPNKRRFIQRSNAQDDSRLKRTIKKLRGARKVSNFDEHQCLLPPCTL